METKSITIYQEQIKDIKSPNNLDCVENTDSTSKPISQAKILDYYKPKFSMENEKVSASKKINSRTQSILEDVCNDFENIHVIETDTGDLSESSVKEASFAKPENETVKFSGNFPILSEDLSEKIYAGTMSQLKNQAPEYLELVDVSDIDISNICCESENMNEDIPIMSNSESCISSLSPVSVQLLHNCSFDSEVNSHSSKNINNDMSEVSYSDSGSNVNATLDSFDLSVVITHDSAVTESISEQKAECDIEMCEENNLHQNVAQALSGRTEDIQIVLENANDVTEESSFSEVIAETHTKGNHVPAVLEKNDVNESESNQTYKAPEIRNTRARRISAKMKVKWAKELEVLGHLVCPMQGCHQTYVTVANFQTHYKWCTGMKNLQHCPHCESVIFSGPEAVLHHMEVEHPEKLDEYKDKCVGEEFNKVELSAGVKEPGKKEKKKSNVKCVKTQKSVKILGKKYHIEKCYKKRNFSAKENFLWRKRNTFKQGLKSIQRTMNQNFKEFKKCVRFNDIVQKINSVSDGPVSEEINSRPPVMNKLAKMKKKFLLSESLPDEGTSFFNDPNDETIDCPSHMINSDIQSCKRVSTKSRIVLNTQGYKRFNEYLKLTRDWASERKTYSRGRSSDSSLNSITDSGSYVLDIHDDYQLNDSTEPSRISLSDPEEVLQKSDIDLDTTPTASPVKNAGERILRKLETSTVKDDIISKTSKAKDDASKTAQNSNIPAGKSAYLSDPVTELNYGHLVFSKPNKIVNRERITCYDNVGNNFNALSSGSEQKQSLDDSDMRFDNKQNASDVPVPPDFDSLIGISNPNAATCVQPKRKRGRPPKHAKASSLKKCDTSFQYVKPSMECLSSIPKSKHCKLDGVKMPSTSSVASMVQKDRYDRSKKQAGDECNAITYNESLKICPLKTYDRNSALQMKKTVKGKLALAKQTEVNSMTNTKASLIELRFPKLKVLVLNAIRKYSSQLSSIFDIAVYETLSDCISKCSSINSVDSEIYDMAERENDSLPNTIHRQEQDKNLQLFHDSNVATTQGDRSNVVKHCDFKDVSEDKLNETLLFEVDVSELKKDYSVTSTKNLVAPARKRGRPPKVPQKNCAVKFSDSGSIGNQTFIECKTNLEQTPNTIVKRKRGRPKKIPACQKNDKISNACELVQPLCGTHFMHIEKVNHSVGSLETFNEKLLPIDIQHSSDSYLKPDSIVSEQSNTISNCTKNSTTEESTADASSTQVLEKPITVRKSSRLRKCKLDPDAVFINPKKVRQFPCTSDHAHSAPAKKSKRGRRRKEVISNTNNSFKAAFDPQEGFDVKHSLDSHIENSIAHAASKQETSDLVSSRKCSRKGRPRKCVRYETLNSGIDSTESIEDRVKMPSSQISACTSVANAILGTQIPSPHTGDNAKSIDINSDHVVPKGIKSNVANSDSDLYKEQSDMTLHIHSHVVAKRIKESRIVRKIKMKKTSARNKFRKRNFCCTRTFVTEDIQAQPCSLSIEEETEFTALDFTSKKAKQMRFSQHISNNDEMNYQENREEKDVKCTNLSHATVTCNEPLPRKARAASVRARKMLGDLIDLDKNMFPQDSYEAAANTKEDDKDSNFEVPFIENGKLDSAEYICDVEKELLNYTEYYDVPVIEKHIASKLLVKNWTDELDKSGKIVCQNEGCGKSLRTPLGMTYHYEHACPRKLEKWRCLICEKTFKPYPEIMLNHMESTHFISRVAEQNVTGKAKNKHVFKKSSDHREHIENFFVKSKQDNLMPEFKPRKQMWKFLENKSDCEEFLPPLKNSVNMKICKSNSEANDVSWFNLACFASSLNADCTSVTLFTGGPVWCSAWCPIPYGVHTTQFIALATSSSMKYHDAFRKDPKGSCLLQLWDVGELTERFNTKPTLKLAITHKHGAIWDMAWCPNGCWEDPLTAVDDEFLPRLGLLAIASADSCVRIYSIPHPQSLNCCAEFPVCHVQPAAVLHSVNGKPCLATQKALCTAVNWQRTDNCEIIVGGYSNGLVALWQVTSYSLMLRKNSSNCPQVFYPYLIFQAHLSPITSVTFAPLCGGQWIATSSFEKSVRIWNLDDPCIPVQELKKGSAKCVDWPLLWTGIFASFDEIQLKTATSYYKNFSLKNIPRCVSTHNACGWSTSVSEWLNVAAVGDASGDVTASVLYRLNSRYYRQPNRYPIFRAVVKPLEIATSETCCYPNGVKFDCDGSDFVIMDVMRYIISLVEYESTTQAMPIKLLNVIGKATENIKFNGCQRLLYKEKASDIDAVHGALEQIITNCELISEEPERDLHIKSSLSCELNKYDDFAKMCGLVFIDQDLTVAHIPEEEHQIIKDYETLDNTVSYDQYNLASINSVLWNPNYGSHCWLFTAGQSGIARILCASGLEMK